MKLAFLLPLCLVPLAAKASFEMQLVLERAGGQAQVRRYDPEHNVNLGTFGRGSMGAGVAIALNQSLQTAYVLDQIGANTVVHRFNYNTGGFTGSFVANGVSNAREIEIAPNGDLMIAGVRGGLSSVHTFSPTGAYLSSVSFYVGNVATDMVRLEDGRTLAAGYRIISGLIEFYLTGYDSSGVPNGFTLLGTAFASQEPWSNAKIARTGNQLLLNRGFYNGQTGASSYAAYLTQDLNPFTGLSQFSAFDPALSNPSAIWMSDLVVGHDGQAWGAAVVGTPNATLTGIRYNASLLSYQYNSPNYDLNNFVDTAIVVAPEPGSLLALGAGLAWLSRRRARS